MLGHHDGAGLATDAGQPPGAGPAHGSRVSTCQPESGSCVAGLYPASRLHFTAGFHFTAGSHLRCRFLPTPRSTHSRDLDTGLGVARTRGAGSRGTGHRFVLSRSGVSSSLKGRMGNGGLATANAVRGETAARDPPDAPPTMLLMGTRLPVCRLQHSGAQGVPLLRGAQGEGSSGSMDPDPLERPRVHLALQRRSSRTSDGFAAREETCSSSPVFPPHARPAGRVGVRTPRVRV